MVDKIDINDLANSYYHIFHEGPTFNYPFIETFGRIEIIGNHTDHNHGKVLTATVNKRMVACLDLTDNNTITIYSKGYEPIIVDISNTNYEETDKGTSKGIVKGIVQEFKNRGYQVGGFNAVIESEIPEGIGISSSASFEVLIARILNNFYNNGKISKLEIAQIAQKSENEYFGKPCGLLDQASISFEGINYLDFKDLDHVVVKTIENTLSNDLCFYLIQTGGSHKGLTPYYAAIKKDMNSIANYFHEEVLRGIERIDLIKNKEKLIYQFGLIPYERSLHFLDENERVELMIESLNRHDAITFLNLIQASGDSSYQKLRNCYCESEEEALSSAIQFVKNNCKNASVRVHGGGFAGSILVVFEKEYEKQYLEILKEHFKDENIIKVVL